MRPSQAVGIPVFKENIAGLSLLKSIGAAQAAAKAAKDKADAKGIERAIKTMATPLKAKWAVDSVNFIEPEADAIKTEYLQTIAENEAKGVKGLTATQEIYFKAKNNQVVEHTTISNAQYDDYVADYSKLSSDQDKKYDHDLSEENLKIKLDPKAWLDDPDNAGNARYTEVAADYKAAKKAVTDAGGKESGATYMFRSMYGTDSDKYGLVIKAPEIKTQDVHDYLKTELPVLKRTTDPTGLREYNLEADRKKTIADVYDSSLDKYGNKWSTNFDAMYADAVKADPTIATTYKAETNPAKKWAQDTFEKDLMVDKAKISPYATAWGHYMGNKAASTSAEGGELAIKEGDDVNYYKGVNIDTQATGANKGKNKTAIVSGYAWSLEDDVPVDIPSSKLMDITAVYVDDAGKSWAVISEPEYTLSPTGVEIPNKNLGVSYKTPFKDLETIIKNNFKTSYDYIKKKEAEYKTGSKTGASGITWKQ